MQEERLAALFSRIEGLLAERGRVVVAIDGRCAAGKTTLAAVLRERFGGTVFHMDDFYLRPEQRTPDRYAEPGGNVDRERFFEEVLLPLREGRAVSYRPFDCGAMRLGEPVCAAPAGLCVVEGSYSLHPALAGEYDLSVFLCVSPEEQRRRILTRDPARAEQFFARWIPLEERYFESCRPEERADFVLALSKMEMRLYRSGGFM